jgi:hypothetical protein
MARIYYRCPDCLIIVTLDKPHHERFFCGNCKSNRPFVFLGEVRQDKLVKIETRCPCDDRCTSAKGPNCDCQCGGANHGAGWLDIVVSISGIPAITPSDQGRKYLAAWHDFNDRVDAVTEQVKQRYGDDFNRFVNREFIANKQTWWMLRNFFESIRAARALKSAHGRVKAIEKIRESLSKSSQIAA